jgi:hypothetical protein
MYLVRGEARAQQNNLTGNNSAASDLNIIRQRAGLPPATETTKEGLTDALLKERQVELCMEGGHRWLDLKRTNRLDTRMEIVTPLKQGVWLPYKKFLPVPLREFLYNPALRGHQNQGYPENE